MNLLVLSQYFWPETFRINEVALSLRDAGHHVDVLTGQPNYPEGRPFDGYKWWKAGVGDVQGLRVHRVPLIPRGRGRALGLVANYMSFVLFASLLGPILLRGRKIDTILVYGVSPILQAIPALVIGRLKGAKVVVWVQDLWPESLAATGYVTNPRLLAMVAWIVRIIYRRSDLLLVQSEAFVPRVTAMAGGTPVRFHPNPGELSFRAMDMRAPAALLPPGFNLVFAGNLGTVQALDTIIDAAGMLTDISDLRIVFVGSGSRSGWLAAEIRRRGLDNVTMLGRFEPEEMPALLDQAAALIVSLARSDILAQTVPSKVQAYLAAGKPIVASLDGEGAKVVAVAEAGVATPAEDATALAQAIRTLYAAPAEDRQRMGRSGRRYYEQHYDPQMLANRLAALMGDTARSSG